MAWGDTKPEKLYQKYIRFKTLQEVYDETKKNYKLKNLVFYVNGDPKLMYNGSATPLGEKNLENVDIQFLDSSYPNFKEMVFISYFADGKEQSGDGTPVKT